MTQGLRTLPWYTDDTNTSASIQHSDAETLVRSKQQRDW
jgi:hypothetical protein